jgi:outer membrane lipoprotein-sorting protein
MVTSRFLPFLSWILCTLLLAGVAFSKPGDEEKKTVLANMKSANEALTTLQARMKQRKISSFMEKEVVTRARFYYVKPGKYRLDPSSSDENEYIINDKQVWIVNHKNKTVTTTGESELNVSHYMMGFGNSADQLETLFDVQVDPRTSDKKFGSYRMVLTPLRNTPLYGKLEKIIVFIRDDLWLPYGAELQESDGDATIWEFSDFKLNGKIKDDLFRLEVPGGYQLKKYEKTGP